MSSPNHHQSLHLLAVERTGWRRYLLGRWVYRSEPFRRDIQRACAAADTKMMLMSHQTLGPEWSAIQALKDHGDAP